MEREQRIRKLFDELDVDHHNYIDADSLAQFMIDRYHDFDGLDNVVNQLIDSILPADATGDSIDYATFKAYVIQREAQLDSSFHSLDYNNVGKLDIEDIRRGFANLGIHIEDAKLAVLFAALDSDDDGLISLHDWHTQLTFIPHAEGLPYLKAAYLFFIEELDLSSDGDVLLSSETSHGLKYFLAGGLAGVVSRTSTAPFDRLKVYLIAQSGSPAAVEAAAAAQKALKASGKKPGFANTSIGMAVKHLWSQGGVRAFFVGNGLNAVKVFPESAMKFGSFEAAKRFFARLEGVSDPSEISRASTFIAGGVGGMVAQLFVYPIDTLKFRIQCSAQFSKKKGHGLIYETLTSMWREGGPRLFYRGISVGVLGIFPFAALDLGIFSAMKKAYLARQAAKLDTDESDVKMANYVVLSMGAMSGSIGASVVYPVNLLRTRLQAQGTAAHPYRYTGFRDVFRKTVKRDGYKGLWRGLIPNLAKVAPAVSISYLVYENAKASMDLD